MPKSVIPALLACSLFASQPATAQEFESWIESFKEEAVAKGISAETYDREMQSVIPVQRVLELNDSQPEFVKGVWEYLDTAVSDSRISNGLNNAAANSALLDRIEEAYGVDKEIIVAIWGLESSYGAIMGDYDVLSALATLGYEGRRTSFGRSQLIGALKILDREYANRSQLKGSWAGAMGQTQFIPTTYLESAVDYDGDGRRDLWSNLGDVFASTANYLSRSGYVANEPWGFEVTLPEGFDYALADRSNRQMVATWASLGINRADGVPLTDDIDLNATGYLIIPAGAQGPAFLVFNNFRAILRYNNSTSYALGIGLLSDHIAGNAEPIVQSWPRGDRPLSLSERKSLQEALAQRGYNPGPVDGIIGAGTKSALRKWQRDQGLPADGYASSTLLTRLLQS
ncbi:lytic murein transglycosylase [Parvularcula sp. IMCC14364]|uniref:lytic murein transglycosylase n=1 Tax=Parvularcula sp. IMCC14364 TaxID=3067902 RepID=UPI002740C021|nr:lytic murein transglycosylase [Parvularcula sp. IMCC14364]